MIAALTNHLWQSTLFAAAAALVTVMLRGNRASVRHWIWLAASLKFLLPFTLLMALGPMMWTLAGGARTPVASPAVSAAVIGIAEPFASRDAVVLPRLTPAGPSRATAVGLAAIWSGWAFGLIAVISLRVRGWQRVRAAVRASVPMTVSARDIRVRSSACLLEPGVVGFWRPLVLMPATIEAYLTPPQFEAVLAHELHHVERRDNLKSAFHMIVEAVFWFHPLVWWIGAHLIDERERACDEYVLRACGQPRIYAEGILTVCRRYVESPVACVSGVTGSDLKRRVAHIMTNRIGLQLDAPRRIALAAAAIAALAIPVLAGAITTSPGTQSPAQPAAKFDVASVKPCAIDKGPAGRHIDTSAHRTYLECFTVQGILDIAYARDGNVSLNQAGPDRNVRGGPDWIRSDRYTIEGTTSATDPPLGAMLRALMEERFHLRSHKIVEQIPMYGLTVAKDGLKITPIAKGDCVDDSADDAPPAGKAGGKPLCGMQSGRKKGTTRIWELGGMPLSALADLLDADRQILDQTHVTGLFNIHLEYDLDEMTTTGTTVFAALEQQLGLKLVSLKGPHEFLVVDHIERPAPDDPTPGGSR